MDVTQPSSGYEAGFTLSYCSATMLLQLQSEAPSSVPEWNSEIILGTMLWNVEFLFSIACFTFPSHPEEHTLYCYILWDALPHSALLHLSVFINDSDDIYHIYPGSRMIITSTSTHRQTIFSFYLRKHVPAKYFFTPASSILQFQPTNKLPIVACTTPHLTTLSVGRMHTFLQWQISGTSIMCREISFYRSAKMHCILWLCESHPAARLRDKCVRGVLCIPSC